MDYYWFDNTGKFAPTPPDFEMNRPSKWCSQPDDWHLAQSLSWFCDFGRKLENLSVSVDTQWCSATDGRTRLHEPRMARWTPVTSLRENLTQTHLDFSYFRTMEPKLTPALRKMPFTNLRHTIWVGDAYLNKPAFGEHFILLSYGCSTDNAVVK